MVEELQAPTAGIPFQKEEEEEEKNRHSKLVSVVCIPNMIKNAVDGIRIAREKEGCQQLSYPHMIESRNAWVF